MSGARSCSWAREYASHRFLELEHVALHRVGGTIRVPVADRLEDLAMVEDRLLELARLVEGEVPDPQREHVVLLERSFQKCVAGAAVDLAVDPLVECHQSPLV